MKFFSREKSSQILYLEPKPTWDSPSIKVGEQQYEEKYVMNNYFGLGIDAKIILEFHKFRDEYPKKTR